jgi:hypothetical protein
MCFSAKLSLTSFLVGIITSLLLIRYGNEESKETNKAIGYFFMFVSIMQLIEYLMWKDLKCVSGLNKIASIFGPLFNHLQPIILLILGYLYIGDGIVDKNIILILNALYFGYVIKKYNPDLTCTTVNNVGHLDWQWKYGFNYNIYHLMMFVNASQFIKNKNLMISLVLSYIILYFNILNKNNIGELWCFSVTGIPLINLFVQKVLKINN